MPRVRTRPPVDLAALPPVSPGLAQALAEALALLHDPDFLARRAALRAPKDV